MYVPGIKSLATHSLTESQGRIYLLAEVDGRDTNTHRSLDPLKRKRELTSREAERLPHDMVCSCFCVSIDEPILTPDGRVLDPDDLDGTYDTLEFSEGLSSVGSLPMTPDAAFPEGVLEVKTRRRASANALRDSTIEAVEKYRERASRGGLKIISIGVTENFVILTDEKTSEFLYGEDMTSLTSAYKMGLRLREQYREKSGRTTESQRRSEILRDSLSTFKPEFDSFDDHAPSGSYSIKTMPYEKARNQYTPSRDMIEVAALRHRSIGEKVEITCVHTPLIVPESSGDMVTIEDLEGISGPECSLWRQAMPIIQSMRERSLLELESPKGMVAPKTPEQVQAARVEMRKRKSLQTRSSSFRAEISGQDRITLSERGLLGKAVDCGLKSMSPGIDLSSPTSWSIEVWLKTKSEETREVDMSELLSSIITCKGDETLSARIVLRAQSYLKTKMAHAWMACDLIHRELVYSEMLNPSDGGGDKEFLVRKVPGYDLYVLIRNTKKGGVQFFSVLFKGESLHDGIGEPVFGKRWKMTKFCSADQSARLARVGCFSKSIALLGLCYDSLSGQDIHSTFKLLCLIQVENRNETSEFLLSLRYYYMKLFSGDSQSALLASAVASKFPEVMRSPVHLFLFKRLHYTHVNLGDSFPRTGLDEEPVENTRPKSVYEKVRSVLGFDITNMEEMLLSCYAGCLHESDGSSYMQQKMKVVDKMLSVAELFKQCVGEDRPKDYCTVRGTAEPEKMRPFQHHEPSVTKGCELMLETIRRVNPLDGDGLSEHILRFLAETSLSDLCSTKSSTVPFIDVNVSKEDMKFSGRRKVFEFLWNEMNGIGPVPMNDPKLVGNLEWLKTRFMDQGGSLQVSFFKKNQLGGVREIYVLTFVGRCMVRICSDIFRAVATLHPSEKLTGPESRSNFCEDLDRDASRRIKGKRMVINLSADKSKWAQNFTMHEFWSMTKASIPKEFHGLIKTTLQGERKKLIALPKDIINAARVGSKKSSAGAEILRRELNGESSKHVVDSGAGILNIENDMMMGILHYPSSVYHLAYSELFVYLVSHGVRKMMSRMGMDDSELVMGFEVSSDDEGYRLWVRMPEPDVMEASTFARVIGEYMKKTMVEMDLLFGIKTSWEKTTLAYTNMYEFNSTFFSGRSPVEPVVKWVARCTDGQPLSSIRQRVSGMESMMTTLRKAGATGELCCWSEIASSLSFHMDNGYKTMSWSRNVGLREIYGSSLASAGLFLPCGPMLSGLVGVEYKDWLACQGDHLEKRVLYALRGATTGMVDEDYNQSSSLKFQVGSSKKYKETLLRMGLNTAVWTVADFFSFLDPAESFLEEKNKCLSMITGPGVCRSMQNISRLDLVRCCPFQFSLPIYICKGQQCSYRNALKKIRDNVSELPIEKLFPAHKSWARVDSVRQTAVYMVRKDRATRSMYTSIQKPGFESPHASRLKTLCRKVWSSVGSYERTSSMKGESWIELKRQLPWLRDSLKETIECDEFPFGERELRRSAEGLGDPNVDFPLGDKLKSLMSFMNSYVKEGSGLEILSRGRVDRSSDCIIAMAEENCSADHRLLLKVESRADERERSLAEIIERVSLVLASKREDDPEAMEVTVLLSDVVGASLDSTPDRLVLDTLDAYAARNLENTSMVTELGRPVFQGSLLLSQTIRSRSRQWLALMCCGLRCETQFRSDMERLINGVEVVPLLSSLSESSKRAVAKCLVFSGAVRLEDVVYETGVIYLESETADWAVERSAVFSLSKDKTVFTSTSNKPQDIESGRQKFRKEMNRKTKTNILVPNFPKYVGITEDGMRAMYKMGAETLFMPSPIKFLASMGPMKSEYQGEPRLMEDFVSGWMYEGEAQERLTDMLSEAEASDSDETSKVLRAIVSWHRFHSAYATAEMEEEEDESEEVDYMALIASLPSIEEIEASIAEGQLASAGDFMAVGESVLVSAIDEDLEEEILRVHGDSSQESWLSGKIASRLENIRKERVREQWKAFLGSCGSRPPIAYDKPRPLKGDKVKRKITRSFRPSEVLDAAKAFFGL